MAKMFFDVFPNLEVGDKVHSLFNGVTVTKVSVTSARDKMRVYLVSEKLIHKKYILVVEQAIGEQFFPGTGMEIKLLEKFHLSRQYTAEKLMPLYRDSILMELKDYSIFEYNMFRQAQCEFTDEDSMHMTVEKNVVAEGKADELIRILEKIFCERCGLSFKIQLTLKEPKESKARRNSELRVQQEVQAILEQVAAAGDGEESAEGEEPVVPDKPQGADRIRQSRRKEKKLPSLGWQLPKRKVSGRKREILPGEATTGEVLSGVPTIRMWSMEETSTRRPFPLNRSRVRWARWSSGVRSSRWKPGRSETRKRLSL